MMYFRIVEENNIYPCGWIFISNEIYDYQLALAQAYIHQKKTGNKTWVQAIK